MVVDVVEMRNHTVVCTRGYICWRVWLLGKVRMVSPVRVICVVV